ncbi:sulfurtransferase complex subunit TusC [Agarivorans sp. DSG3-1]|uniref:sulfurtransferase complex subunit TusC n=1 Tax=Agarivorans sp. DSG3-1 TaxID=3342249 RepID=UPI00398E3FE2
MNKSLVFVFGAAPHGSSLGREALDAALASSAISEDVVVFFDGDGVWQLVNNQDTAAVLQRDVLPTYGLLDLYDVEEIFIDTASMQERGLALDQLAITVRALDSKEFYSRHCNAHAILRF